MRDAIASSLVEETYGIQIAEWGWMPHDFHSIRRRLSSGLSHPDDVRAMHMSSCNRKHRYVEHYRHKIGNEETTMIQRWSNDLFTHKHYSPILFFINFIAI